jgi:hypothetical protein
VPRTPLRYNVGKKAAMEFVPAFFIARVWSQANSYLDRASCPCQRPADHLPACTLRTYMKSKYPRTESKGT